MYANYFVVNAEVHAYNYTILELILIVLGPRSTIQSHRLERVVPTYAPMALLMDKDVA